MKIILATASPYRIKVFRDAGIEFEAQASEVDETFKERPKNPSELVGVLAKLKAQDVAKKYNDGIVIGFDSIGYFDGEILEKPKSEQDAFERLRRLSGNSYSFFTGIYMINKANGKDLARVVKTTAQMRNFSQKEIKNYLRSDSLSLYKTYAQGFDPVKGISSTFIKSINGSYLNILQGIPLETIVEMLEMIQ